MEIGHNAMQALSKRTRRSHHRDIKQKTAVFSVLFLRKNAVLYHYITEIRLRAESGGHPFSFAASPFGRLSDGASSARRLLRYCFGARPI